MSRSTECDKCGGPLHYDPRNCPRHGMIRSLIGMIALVVSLPAAMMALIAALDGDSVLKSAGAGAGIGVFMIVAMAATVAVTR